MIKPMPIGSLVDYVNPPAGFEVIRYTLYDRQLVNAAAFTAQTFFAHQVGVGGVTLADTNMQKPSAIGNPNRFLGQWLNFAITTATIANYEVHTMLQNVGLIINNCVMRIDVLSKEYLTVPCWMVPAGGGLWASIGSLAAAGTEGAVPCNGTPDKRNAYQIELPLEREASFSVTVQNPMPITSTVNLYMYVAMTGLMLRPKQ